MTHDRKTLVHWDREHLWHPFTQMKGFREEELLIISRGQGNYLFDLEGAATWTGCPPSGPTSTATGGPSWIGP